MTYVIIAIIVVALLFIIKNYRDGRLLRDKLLNKFILEFDKLSCNDSDRNALELIGHYSLFKSKHNDEKSKYLTDDITWNDLKLDQVFMSIDSCQTFYGQEVLYDYLKRPVLLKSILDDREAEIKKYDANPEKRAKVLLGLHDIGFEKKIPLCDVLEAINGVQYHGVLVDYLCLCIGVVASILIFALPTFGFFLFLAALFFNTVSYFKHKKSVDRYVSAYVDVLRLISYGEYIKEIDEEIIDSALISKLLVLKRFSFLITSGPGLNGSLLELPLDYLRMFLHLDMIRVNSILPLMNEYKDDLLCLSERIGRIDALLSISAYRKRTGTFCRPEFSKDGFNIKNLYHPLLLDGVPNDINLGGSILLTGSNATGKSTFLRSIALAAIMAQSINTVTAEGYMGDFVRVATSMAISDDLTSGKSYYMAEIESIKRIIEYANSETKLLCMIDEVLRGTNTAERIAASAQILKQISVSGAICIAASHDVELCDLVASEYTDYHFEETVNVSDNSISFSYKVLPGRCNSRNAIKLLAMMGYPDSIVNAADKSCENYLKNGVFL